MVFSFGRIHPYKGPRKSGMVEMNTLASGLQLIMVITGRKI
jgi:hypothetical protein